MRWLVTGSAGQLGHALVEGLGRRGDAVHGFSRDQLDVTDPAALERVLAALPAQPDVLVNAAAYTDVDGCESHAALALGVNGEAPGSLARACRQRGVRLVHVSTDYVFDGEAPEPYAETAPTGPVSAYGRSKLAGERAVFEADPQALVVRTAWLYGRGPNFVAAVCRKALAVAAGQAGSGLRVVDDQSGCPTWASDLAGGLVALVEHGASGLYHLANRGVATRWELAREALDLAGLAEVPIQRVRTSDYPTPARRPRQSALRCDRAAEVGVVLRPWREALAAYLESPDSPLAPEDGP